MVCLMLLILRLSGERYDQELGTGKSWALGFCLWFPCNESPANIGPAKAFGCGLLLVRRLG